MPRKTNIDKEPVVQKEGAAVKPAKASVPKAAPKAPAVTKARAPRSSATAVTHKHKKSVSVEVSGTEIAAVEESTTPAPRKIVAPPTREEIAIRAYLLYEGRGYQGGSETEDWITAERQLLAERGQQ